MVRGCEGFTLARGHTHREPGRVSWVDMAEILVLAAMPAALLIFTLLLWRGNRRMEAALAAALQVRGWQQSPSANGIIISVPFGGRVLAIEPYLVPSGRSQQRRSAMRHVGVESPDMQLFWAPSYAADKVRPGLVEVPLAASAQPVLRAFASDPSAFSRAVPADVVAALVAAKWPGVEISVERGTLSMTFPFTLEIALLDRLVAVFHAIAIPSAPRLAGLQAGVRPTMAAAWGCAIGVALFVGVLAGVIGASVSPLPDHSIGRAIAAPVVCPNGGTPDVLHYSTRPGSGNWNVTCEKKAGTRTGVGTPGAYEPSRFPSLTTGILSFEVYFLVSGLFAALALLIAAKIFSPRQS
jgi:hypothetical protein